MFAPELSEDEIKTLLEGHKIEDTKASLIDGEVIIDEDENTSELNTTTDMGNWT